MGKIYTADNFVKSSGTSSQFLKADGSIDSSTYATTSQLHDAVTLGTTGILNGLSLSGQVLSLATASSTTRGALTAEDYNYFFAKQNALTNPVTGTGTTGTLPKFTGASTLGNSLIYDNGTNIGIGTASPTDFGGSYRVLDVLGTNAMSITRSSGGVIGQVNAAGTDALYIGTRSNHNVNLTANNSNVLTLTSGGNVGIGTTSPANKLSVNGNIETTGSGKIGFNVNDSYGDFPHYGIGYAGGGNLLNLAGYFGLSFGTIGLERMRIFSSGNVFIGSSPTDAGYKLDVNGTGRFSGAIVVNGMGTFGKQDYSIQNTQKVLTLNGDAVSGVYAGNSFRFYTKPGALDSAQVLSIRAEYNGTESGNLFAINGTGATTFASTVTATGFFNSSDNRLKDIISQDGDVIEFTWKDGRDNKKHIGVIAQEVQKLYPDMVQEGTDEEKTLSVNYIELLVLKNRQLEKRIESLEKLISNSK
jgi:hypothetical protein